MDLKSLALEAAHARRREQAAEQRVLAAALDAASPALVASDVDHRREVPVDARARRFERGDLGGAAARSGSKLATSASGTGKMVRWP